MRAITPWFFILIFALQNNAIFTIRVPIYPSMLTPSSENTGDGYAAFPNYVHASIQYGEENDKNRIISRHFHHNGYEHYDYLPKEEPKPDRSIGVAEVIKSMLDMVQVFPQIGGAYHNGKTDDDWEAKPIKNPFLHDTKVQTAFEVVPPTRPSFSFPKETKNVSDVQVIATVQTLPITTTQDTSLEETTTTIRESTFEEEDESIEVKTTPSFFEPSLMAETTQRVFSTASVMKDQEQQQQVATTTSLMTSSTSTSQPHYQHSSAFPTSTYDAVTPPHGSIHGAVRNPWTTLNQVDRHQCTYSDQVSFPCAGPDAKASFYKPTSVHRLRPGDVQIIAALGDALVSAQGALSAGITSAGEQYRGVSFATGGDEDWRTVLTIPNILREFNPRLIGTSAAKGGSKSGFSGFNVANPFAFSADLESQAEELISRIKRNIDADFREDWKLVMILIGQNDLCKLACIHNGTLAHFDGGNNRPQTPEEFAKNLKQALDTLMKGLPKSLVALILPPDPTLIMEAFHRPLVCHLSSKVICPCVDGPHNIGRTHMLKVLEEYHQAIFDLIEEEGYDKYNDFAVVVQPGLKDMHLPKNDVTLFGMHRSFLPDLSYLSSDCFHPSQKLQALYAKNIWNNLLEPAGAKSNWKRYSTLNCPTSERPFLSTRKNSEDFDDYSAEKEEDRPFQRKRLVRRKRKRINKRSPFFDIITGSSDDGTCDLL